MNEQSPQPQWRAPEILQQYQDIEHTIFVSSRPSELICIESNLEEEKLAGKKIVSIANGLSSFVPQLNELGQGTECYGVDPSYGYIGENYKAFLDNLKKMKLSPHQGLNEQQYQEFFTEENKRHLIAGDGTELPLASESTDLVNISYLLGYLDDPEVGKKILAEALRIIKPDGEIRVPDVHLVMEDGMLSFSYKQMFVNESDRRFMPLITTLIDNNARVYTVRNLKPIGHQTPPIREDLARGEKVEAYSTLIIRKDETPPEVDIWLPSDLAEKIMAERPGDIIRQIDAADKDEFAMESHPVKGDITLLAADLKARTLTGIPYDPQAN